MDIKMTEDIINFMNTEYIISSIREYFKITKSNIAVIGMSGGKDSFICAALCARALDAKNVIGVLIPTTYDKDYVIAQKQCEYLGIKSYICNIREMLFDIGSLIPLEIKNKDKYDRIKINTPPRLRMSVLYAISDAIGGRVINTCNKSEDYIGYSTKYGDAAGDFSIFHDYTCTDVIEIGKALGLPEEWIYKTPTDGLCGLTDEEKIGFSYNTLDNYIKYKKCDNEEIARKIDEMHERAQHKILNIPYIKYIDFC